MTNPDASDKFVETFIALTNGNMATRISEFNVTLLKFTQIMETMGKMFENVLVCNHAITQTLNNAEIKKVCQAAITVRAIERMFTGASSPNVPAESVKTQCSDDDSD